MMKKKMRRFSMFLASVMILNMLMVANLLVINVFAAPIFPFTDVKSDAWYYKDVKHAYEKKLINGKTQSLYGPDENMTYAEAVKLAACMHQLKKEGSVKLKNGTPWYQSYVDYAKKHKLITSDLAWNSNATRGGYMEIFANVLTDAESKKNNVPDGSIPDVGLAHQNATAIYKLYRAGIVTGVDAKHHCDPDASIKRSEVAAILTRMTDKSKRVAFSMSSSTTADSGGSSSGGGDSGSGSGSGGSGGSGSGSGSGGSGGSGSGSGSGGSGGGSGLGSGLSGATLTPGPGRLPSIKNSLKIKSHPLNAEGTDGDTLEFTVEAQGGKEPYSYQWQIQNIGSGEFENLTGEDNMYGEGIAGKFKNKLKLAFNSLDDNMKEHIFRCVVTDADGGSVTSNQAVAKYSKMIITQNPVDALNVRPTDYAKLKVEAQGGKKPYSYKWEIKNGYWEPVDSIPADDLNKYFDGWATDTLSVKASKNYWVYYREFRCEVSDANGNFLYSNSAKITVDKLRVTKQPQNALPIPGEGFVGASVEVTGGISPYTFTWKVFRPEEGKWSNLRDSDGTMQEDDGNKSDIMFWSEIGAYLNGKDLRCVIEDITGDVVLSNIVTITIRE